MHSIRSIAALISEKDGLSEDAGALVHSHLRNLVARKYIRPLPGKRGRTTSGSFDELEAVRARILVELIGSGYRTYNLDPVNALLPDTLQQIMRGVSMGEDCRLRIERWKTPAGEFYHLATVVWASNVDGASEERSSGDVLRKVDELRLTPLLAGFIDL